MFLIVGLGNPGLSYAYTRHNVGFMFADQLAYSLGFPDYKSKFDSLYSEKVFEQTAKIIIQKPQTFMNLSGRAVSQIVSFYKIPTENVFVLHDDLDLNPLDVKIKFAGSNGGHNGLRDIDKAIGTKYWRIRVGIGRPITKDKVADYVLSPFYKDEISTLLPKVFDPLCQNMLNLIFAESNEKQNVISKIIQEVKNK